MGVREINLTTIGIPNIVIFDDLSGRSFTHPVNNFNLLDEYGYDKLAKSIDLQNAIINNSIVLRDENGVVLNSIELLNILHNFDIVDPTIYDGIDMGYSIGSRWINVLTNVLFVCVDNTLDDAIWINPVTGFTIQKDGIDVVNTPHAGINFISSIVEAIDNGDIADIKIGTQYQFSADMFDDDGHDPSLASDERDPITTLEIMAFDDTTEEGVRFVLRTDKSMDQIRFKYCMRAAVAPGVPENIVMKLKARQVTDNGVLGSWSSYTFASDIIPANTNYQYFSKFASYVMLGIVADKWYQFEFVRDVSNINDTLIGDLYLLSLFLQFK